MSAGRDEGPVYYREVQKNAYLKRIPNDIGASKLRPLGHKKPALKPMWTLFCVHNGRTPFLEQYPDAQCAGTLAHKPLWRACLLAARHVTASVKPHQGDEYDFLIDTDQGPVRMLAPDWDSMNDWVITLRSKLHELKILSKGENVYCAPPAPPAPRAAARDPTSPLPPTPPVPPDRVPGIDLTTVRPNPEPQDPQQEPRPDPDPPEPENIDISSWDTYAPQPSTSNHVISTSSVTKICGQNICLDDSILKRNVADESDDEFASEVGSEEQEEFKQRVMVDGEVGDADSGHSNHSDRQATNITVIQVSNRPPHTAIPVMGTETNIFDFNFKQKLTLNPEHQNSNSNSFVNIVNTEATENGYGTVFDKDDYGHLSLTTTVNLTGDAKTDNEGIYERLCMASTSQNSMPSPLPVRKLRNLEKSRKSSLPNLDSESTYEYLFPSQNNNRNGTKVTLNSSENSITNGGAEVNSNNTRNTEMSRTNATDISRNTTDISGNTTDISRNTTDISRNTTDISRSTTDISRNTTDISRNTTDNSRNISLNNEISRNDRSETQGRPIVHVNLTSSISVGNVDLNARVLRSNVERSHSQNAYDSSPGMREHLIRRIQNNSPKREVKNDKCEPQPKPIWKRGLTELSLLSRLRGVGQRRHESPTRHDSEAHDRGVTSPAKVVHRSRPEGRIDGTRRRSSSLSNGQSPPSQPTLQPLRARQAASLRAEQRRGAAVAATLSARDNIVLCDYNRQVWIVFGGSSGARWGSRAGDRLVALRGATPRDAAHARQLLKSAGHVVDMLFHRVPLGKIYVLNKRDLESIGVKLDGECNITGVEGGGAAARAGIPPPGKWAVTEVNNRPLNLLKGGEEEMNRLSMHGSEVSVLIQPSALVKKMRAALKGNKHLLSIR